MEIIPDDLYGSNVITSVLKSERGNQKSLCQSQRRRFDEGSRGQNIAVTDLKMTGKVKS